MQKIRSDGFIVLEFAIALPLLILVMYGLAIVSVNIFLLGKEQLADYALEEEARYVMELITQKVRAAKEVEAYNSINKIKIVYHAVDDWYDERDNGYYHISFKDDDGSYYNLFGDRDVLETQYIFPYQKSGNSYSNLYAERQESSRTNPITGENFFGYTKLNYLQFSKLNDNVLRIELELESLETGHKIKIATAVFMPSYEPQRLEINDE